MKAMKAMKAMKVKQGKKPAKVSGAKHPPASEKTKKKQGPKASPEDLQKINPKASPEQKYEPGKLLEIRNVYVENFIQNAESEGETVSKKDAIKAWQESIQLARLLKDVPLTDLKRRRFVRKEATTNPFY